MKRSVVWVLLAMFLFLLTVFGAYAKGRPQSVANTIIYVTSEAQPSDFDESIVLNVLFTDKIQKMTLKAYLEGVLAAEMPQSFPIEAFKAQAVAARTFTLRQAASGKHKNADVCISSSCCQGWTDERSEAGIQAITATDGLVITYENELIDATYFSCSGGSTESAVAVWGSDIPYLQAVASLEENAPGAYNKFTISLDEFTSKLAQCYPQINFESSTEDWIKNITYTEGGGINTVIIGGICISGTSLRNIFSLHSTNIALELNENYIDIETYGYGHRVGMSQYGAKKMAEVGHRFSDILTHYYQGTVIQQLYKEKAPLPKAEEA